MNLKINATAIIEESYYNYNMIFFYRKENDKVNHDGSYDCFKGHKDGYFRDKIIYNIEYVITPIKVVMK